MIRYLQFATYPVMGRQARTPEGLRKILERFASEFEGYVAADEELAAVIEGMQTRGETAAASLAASLAAPAAQKYRRRSGRIRACELVRGRRRANAR